jgi:hypothetical protein
MLRIFPPIPIARRVWEIRPFRAFWSRITPEMLASSASISGRDQSGPPFDMKRPYRMALAPLRRRPPT